MKHKIQSIKGMHDYIEQDIFILNKIEYIFKKILLNYNYLEIRLPILEKTKLFKKTIGKNTDIIGKEMYSFYDKKGNSITLRPEATAGCIRSVLQNGLIHNKKQKLWYYGPMFRYEKPQHGRYRQFYQLGIETFGFSKPYIELEIITIINKFFNKMNISNFIKLEINSIGCIDSRIKYRKKLITFLEKYKNILNVDCQRKLYLNPLRILDNKNKNIQKILLKSPNIINYINIYSRLQFEKLCYLMKLFNIKYSINHRLVRGLDYYNNTVFEWKTNYLGSKNTICAGGRYDTLVQQLGGPKTPAIGLAIGIDRLLLLIKSLSIIPKFINIIDIYIFFEINNIRITAIKLSEKIRSHFLHLKILL